jgi:hypothetical protein
MTPQYIEINELGNKFYYKDKEMTIIHREDGPAAEWSYGDKAWYINGHLHRLDGPAIESLGGVHDSWYINGKGLTKKEFLKQTAPEIVLTMDEIAAKLGIEVSKLKIKK